MKRDIHATTMSHNQRVELIRILSVGLFGHEMESLACLTDTELHKQWLAECRYIPITEAALPIIEDK